MKRNKVLRGGFSEPLDFTFFLSLSIVLIYTHTRTRSRVHVEAYIPVAARNTRPRKNTKRDARTRSRKLSFSLLHTSSPHSISPFTLTLALAPCALAFPLSTLVICPPSLPFPPRSFYAILSPFCTISLSFTRCTVSLSLDRSPSHFHAIPRWPKKKEPSTLSTGGGNGFAPRVLRFDRFSN